MACTASISMAPSSVTHRFRQSFLLAHKPSSSIISAHFKPKGFENWRKNENLNSCLVVEKRAEDSIEVKDDDEAPPLDNVKAVSRVEERLATEKPERYTYLVAAILSSVGITSMAVHYRFLWQMEVGMEFWARWAHRALWHASSWHMHESHHRPRNVPFELNDVFAIINAVPAIALFSYGFFNEGLLPGLCFGAGLGITVFGMAYMFVHDGLVHRIPVGPVANVPYLRRVAAAHQLHHADKFDGVPYGLFLGPNELEEVGGLDELDKEVQRRIKSI
ncbi:hypothetical protein OIU84_022199 [Salix udensis]|uniref:beta-carotene 3-hydroxylase n=1 Tax=Salix udensis TaxID=889485 RepID=A0AAD6PFG4_9ROSI|nr:hypothetical protein OIU84_022199 [Salix udensis]